jgi:hypothetical protein
MSRGLDQGHPVAHLGGTGERAGHDDVLFHRPPGIGSNVWPLTS